MPDVTQEQLFKLALEIKGQEEMKRLADETGKAGQAVGEYIAKIKDLSAEQMAADPKLRELMQRFQDLGEQSMKAKEALDKLNKDPGAEAGNAFDALGSSLTKVLQSGSIQEAGQQILDLGGKIKETPWDLVGKALTGPAGWIAAGTALVAFMPTLVSSIKQFTTALAEAPVKQFNADMDAMEKKARNVVKSIGDVAGEMAKAAGPPRSDTQKEADTIRAGIIESLSPAEREAFERQNLEFAMGQELADDKIGSTYIQERDKAQAEIDKYTPLAEAAQAEGDDAGYLAYHRMVESSKDIKKAAEERLDKRKQELMGKARGRAERAQREGGYSAARALYQIGSMSAMAGDMRLRNRYNEFIGAGDTARQRVIDQGEVDMSASVGEAQAQIAAAQAKDRAEGIKDTEGDMAAGQRWDDFIKNREEKAKQKAKQAADKAKQEADKAQREAEAETQRQAQLAAQAFGQNQAAQLQLQQGILAGNDTSAIAADLAKQLVSPVTGMVAAKRAADQIVMQAQAQAHAQMMSLMQVYNDDRIAQAMMWRQWQEQMMQFQAGMQLRGRW